MKILQQFWLLAKPYWTSEEKWWAISLLCGCLLLNMLQTFMSIELNAWNNSFYNSLQFFNKHTLIRDLIKFVGLFSVLLLAFGFNIYLLGLLSIRWRRWQTQHTIKNWLTENSYYLLQLNHRVDNPDQRISDDIELFSRLSGNLFFMFVDAIFTLVSFSAILWKLSGVWHFSIHGIAITIPGYLLWASLGYAIIGTFLNHWIGHRLAGLNYQQQKFNADFRYRLVRLREASEQIALLKGEQAEEISLQDTFKDIFENFLKINVLVRNLSFFQNGYRNVTQIFGLIIAAPKVFAEKLSFGFIAQTTSAFGNFTDALSILINSYAYIAEWRAVITRLLEFKQQIESCQEEYIAPNYYADTNTIQLNNLNLFLPDHTPLLQGFNLTLTAQKSVLIMGRPGAGKSTLLRTIAGIWPYKDGSIVLPKNQTLLFLPQRAYLPIDSIAAILSYPNSAFHYTETELRNALNLVGLPELVEQLHHTANWSQQLSLGEQQMLQFARALLKQPDWLFLDEATSAVDIATEAKLYQLIKTHLPTTTVISAGHRTSLIELHDEKIVI